MRTLTVALALALMLCSTAFGVQNAGPTWNLFAGAHNFEQYPQGSGETFAQNYNGSQLAVDFADMIRLINSTLGTNVVPGENDLLNASLENWPAGGGT